MTENPGYLKLRKIRAAQHIAQTVRQMFYTILPCFCSCSKKISNAQNRVYLNAEALMLDLGSMNTE